jgi:hypothetical protein
MVMLLLRMLVVPVVQAQVRRASTAAAGVHCHRQLALRPGKIHALLLTSSAAAAPVPRCNKSAMARAHTHTHKQTIETNETN